MRCLKEQNPSLWKSPSAQTVWVLAKYQQPRKCDWMTARVCRGKTEDLSFETCNGTGLSWCLIFGMARKTKKWQRWEFSSRSFSVTGTTAKHCKKGNAESLLTNLCIYNIHHHQTAHGTRPGQRPSLFIIGLNSLSGQWRDGYRADGILLEFSSASHSPETRQAQADGEAGNGHRGFALSLLQVRRKLQCWGACTVLQKFIVAEAQRGYLWASNLTCCLTQTIEFQTATLIHSDFFFSFYIWVSFSCFVCLFFKYKVQIPQLPVHHLKKILFFLKSKQSLIRKQPMLLPCCPSC